MRLPELQKNFAAALLHAPTTALCSLIESSADLSSEDRLAVYQNNVFVGLFESLKNIFPVTVKLVDVDFFRGVAGGYIRQYPPTSALLDEYGKDLPDYLQNLTSTQHLHYLGDMARFEWLLHESAQSQNDLPLQPSTLATLNANNLDSVYLPLRAHVRLMHTPHPVGSVWRYCQQNAESKAPDLTKAPRGYILYRLDQFENWFEEIDIATLTALKNLAAGRNLYQALEAANQIDVNFDITRFMQFAFIRELLKGSKPHAVARA